MKKAIVTIVLAISIWSTTQAQDILNNTFNPSIERGHLINIGSDKERVGNNIFEGGTNISIGKDNTCSIYNTILQIRENECSKNNNRKRDKTQKYCINTEPTNISATSQTTCATSGIRTNFNTCTIHGRRIHANDKQTCETQTAKREKKGATIQVGKQDPLLARIAKLLLRITIAIAITFTLYNAIIYAVAAEKDAQKKLLNIVRGIIIALSSISIIYLIQSITTQSATEIQKTIKPLHEE